MPGNVIECVIIFTQLHPCVANEKEKDGQERILKCKH